LKKEFDLNTVSRIAKGPLTFWAFNDREVTCINCDFEHVTTSLVEYDAVWCILLSCHEMWKMLYQIFIDWQPRCKCTGWHPTGKSTGPGNGTHKLSLVHFLQNFLSDVRINQNLNSVDDFRHSCFYWAYTGYDCAIALDSKYVGIDEQPWTGMDACSQCSHKIGLLLDLD
jgi:hypothetical protein